MMQNSFASKVRSVKKKQNIFCFKSAFSEKRQKVSASKVRSVKKLMQNSSV